MAYRLTGMATRLNNQITSEGMPLRLVIVRSFFCIHGLTSGVARTGIKRKAVFRYQCGGYKVTKGCTEELVRLTKKVGESMKSTAYCRMCVQKDTRDRTHREKQKGAKLQPWDVISARSRSIRLIGQRATILGRTQ